MARSAEERSDDKYGLDRIVFFSDAVIAIAITLLVITITVPAIDATKAEAELADALSAMWPQFLGFAVSFWVIAGSWISHHRVFRYITDYDRNLIHINILFLMSIAFMPFATNLLFTYPGVRVSVLVYAGLVSVIGLTLAGLWAYASRGHRLVSDSLSQETTTSIGWSLLSTPAAMLTSMGIALFDPAMAMYSWIFLLPFFGWLAGRTRGAKV
jgi:uncharacterized membrane protein